MDLIPFPPASSLNRKEREDLLMEIFRRLRPADQRALLTALEIVFVARRVAKSRHGEGG